MMSLSRTLLEKDKRKKKKKNSERMEGFMTFYIYIYIYIYIIYYIIIVGFKSFGCDKWLRQITENFLDF